MEDCDSGLYDPSACIESILAETGYSWRRYSNALSLPDEHWSSLDDDPKSGEAVSASGG